MAVVVAVVPVHRIMALLCLSSLGNIGPGPLPFSHIWNNVRLDRSCAHRTVRSLAHLLIPLFRLYSPTTYTTIPAPPSLRMRSTQLRLRSSLYGHPGYLDPCKTRIDDQRSAQTEDGYQLCPTSFFPIRYSTYNVRRSTFD
jgi:hypothetical protein